MSITEITIGQYTSSPQHKALADDLMRRAGVNADDCAGIELRDGLWHFKVIRRTLLGKIDVDSGGVAYRDVTLAAASVPQEEPQP